MGHTHDNKAGFSECKAVGTGAAGVASASPLFELPLFIIQCLEDGKGNCWQLPAVAVSVISRPSFNYNLMMSSTWLACAKV